MLLQGKFKQTDPMHVSVTNVVGRWPVWLLVMSQPVNCSFDRLLLEGDVNHMRCFVIDLQK